jgi:hypothetical protein
MAVVLDLIGMLIIRASIIAIILNLMVNMHEALYRYAERNSLNTSLVGVQQTISADIMLAGYNSTNKRFPLARRNDMSFRTDYDNDNDVDSIRYFVSPSTGTNKVLYRVVNTTSGASVSRSTSEVARDVDTFYMNYYNLSGSSLSYGTNVNNIKSVLVTVRIASKNTMLSVEAGKSDSVARTMMWQQHFFPDNLY